MTNPEDTKYKYFEEVNEAVLRQIPLNKSCQRNLILDVGCGMGALSEAIQEKGYRVWGIELNKEAAAVCQKRITRSINIDLTRLDSVEKEIGGELFDYIIFADILEHLHDEPSFMLKYYLRFLKNDGRIIVSLPNVLVWSNRVMFLLGRFEYTDAGIMDRNHIRFYTLKSAKRLIKSCGCSVIRTDYIPYFTRVAQPLFKKLLLRNKKPQEMDKKELMESPYYKWYMKYINPIEYCLGYPFKSIFAFKMIIVGKKE